MKKKLTWVCLCLILAATFAIGAAQKAPREGVIDRFEQDLEQLELIAQCVLEKGDILNIDVPDGWTKIALYNKGTKQTTVEFQKAAGGLGSSSVYRGINYVPSDMMLGFQGTRWEYWKAEGSGRLFYEPESDNTCYVQRLAPCWYLYEARF